MAKAKKYQKGAMVTKEGNVPDRVRIKGEKDAIQQKKWLENWLKSPEARAIAERNATLNRGENVPGQPNPFYEQADALLQPRLNNLGTVRTQIGDGTDTQVMGMANALAMYRPATHHVGLAPQGYGDNTPLHEYTHASTRGNKELQTSGNMERFYEHNPVLNEYFENPTEVHARLTVARKLLHEWGVKPNKDGRYDAGKIESFIEEYRDKVNNDENDDVIQLLDYQIQGENKTMRFKDLLENVVDASPTNNNATMAKYGGKVKKMQMGGMPDLSSFNDLLKGFKNSDQSTWMTQAKGFGTNNYFNLGPLTTPQDITDQGIAMMQGGYDKGVAGYKDAFFKEHRQGDLGNSLFEQNSWWDRNFRWEKTQKKVDEQVRQAGENSINYQGNLAQGAAGQVAGIGSLLSMFSGLQGIGGGSTNSFNPAQWFTNPTRGYQFGGNIMKPGVTTEGEVKKNKKLTAEEQKKMQQLQLLMQLVDPTGITSYPELTALNDPNAKWDDKTMAVISALPALGKFAKIFGKSTNAVRVGTEVEQHRRQTEYQLGGDIAQKGYSQGSPYGDMPAIPIPGNKIDMSNTNIPLLLIPNKGKPKLAQPNSGTHKFKGATEVLEIPLMQEGGEVPSETEMMGMEGVPEDTSPVPIQAEVGEVAAMEDGGIVDVKAKKRHKGMDDEEVTDILPPGSFIASRDKKMEFSKEEAKDVIFGYNPIKYEEDSQTTAPKEHTAADIMTKDKMTPADYLKLVRNLYPVTDREDDAFAQKAVEENLQSRLPYIQSAMYMTDMKKPESAKNNPEMAKYGYLIPRVQMQENPFMGKLGIPGMEFKNGGAVGAEGNNPKKYWVGAVIAAAASLLGAGIQAGGAAKSKKRLDANYQDTIGILDKTKGLQTGNLGLGSAAALAGILGQNPNVEAPQLDPRYIEAMPQEMPRYMHDYAASQINMASQPTINYATRNAPSFTRGMNSLGGMQAQQFSALGNLSMQRAQQNVNMRQNYLQQRGAMANDQIRMDTDALNRTRGNRNTMIQNVGAVGSNYFSGMNALEANDAGNRITAGNVRTTGQNIASQNYTNAMSMLPFAVAQGFQGIDWSNKPSTVYQPNFGQFNFNGQQQAPPIIPGQGNTSAGLWSTGQSGNPNMRWNYATQSWEPR